MNVFSNFFDTSYVKIRNLRTSTDRLNTPISGCDVSSKISTKPAVLLSQPDIYLHQFGESDCRVNTKS